MDQLILHQTLQHIQVRHTAALGEASHALWQHHASLSAQMLRVLVQKMGAHHTSPVSHSLRPIQEPITQAVELLPITETHEHLFARLTALRAQ